MSSACHTRQRPIGNCQRQYCRPQVMFLHRALSWATYRAYISVTCLSDIWFRLRNSCCRATHPGEHMSGSNDRILSGLCFIESNNNTASQAEAQQLTTARIYSPSVSESESVVFKAVYVFSNVDRTAGLSLMLSSSRDRISEPGKVAHDNEADVFYEIITAMVVGELRAQNMTIGGWWVG